MIIVSCCKVLGIPAWRAKHWKWQCISCCNVIVEYLKNSKCVIVEYLKNSKCSEELLLASKECPVVDVLYAQLHNYPWHHF